MGWASRFTNQLWRGFRKRRTVRCLTWGDNMQAYERELDMPRKVVTPHGKDSTDARWEAVVARDGKADGMFVYAVTTTGVYCRPSCASRRAKRENVKFFGTTADAERAGFRACKRCMPNRDSLGQLHASMIANACRSIETAENE